MKPIEFSKHAQEQMVERGATESEVVETIRTGEIVPAKHSRQGHRKNFQYGRLWGERTFAIKQILAIVAEEADALIAVTVYTFYF